jgi:hypothetical protein
MSKLFHERDKPASDKQRSYVYRLSNRYLVINKRLPDRHLVIHFSFRVIRNLPQEISSDYCFVFASSTEIKTYACNQLFLLSRVQTLLSNVVDCIRT